MKTSAIQFTVDVDIDIDVVVVKSGFDDRASVILMQCILRDAKIAALVQNSADTDKLLADARLEKLAYLKELHNANERCAHLEARYEHLNDV